MNPHDVAKGLSGGETVAMTCRIVHIASRMRDRLVAKTLLVKAGNDWTPLGLDVRAIIQEQSNDRA